MAIPDTDLIKWMKAAVSYLANCDLDGSNPFVHGGKTHISYGYFDPSYTSLDNCPYVVITTDIADCPNSQNSTVEHFDWEIFVMAVHYNEKPAVAFVDSMNYLRVINDNLVSCICEEIEGTATLTLTGLDLTGELYYMGRRDGPAIQNQDGVYTPVLRYSLRINSERL